jgi:iron complex outermembrane recepter protein
MRSIPVTFVSVLTILASAQSNTQAIQRAASDAFGTRIGDESVGLYSESLVRGFSLQEAGNYLIEDAYFVRGARLLSNSVNGSSTVRVGPNALGFDFPSPAGVIQYRLLSDAVDRSEIQLSISDALETNLRPGLRGFLSRKTDQQQSISGGFVAPSERYADGVQGQFYSVGGIARSPIGAHFNATLIADFADWRRQSDVAFRPLSSEQNLPRVRRYQYVGQSWNQSHTKDENLGLIVRYDGFADWLISASSIFSKTALPRYGTNIFSLDPNGFATGRSLVNLDRSVTGRGHELSAKRSFATDNTRSQLRLNMRLRRSDFQSPQSFSAALPGFAMQDGPAIIDTPVFVESAARALSATDQNEVGVAWQWRHRNQIALNAGLRRVQTTLVNRPIEQAKTQRRDHDILCNVALVYPWSETLTSFATRTTGLEEAGFAPANADNRFAALAPVRSSQTELGLKWQLNKDVNAIVTAFDLQKPDAGLSADNRYDYIGNVRHRGVEASLSGAINANWNVVAGAMWMRPRLSGVSVDQGLIADEPVGRSATLGLLSLNYQPTDQAWSIDGSYNFYGGRPANAQNTRYTAGNSLVNLGMRYRFQIGAWPAQWRVRLFNVADHFDWIAAPNGLQTYTAPRRLDVMLIIGQ